MKDDILNKVKALRLKAKEEGNKEVKVHLSSQYSTALNQAIKTKEQADLFMERLKALG